MISHTDSDESKQPDEEQKSLTSGEDEVKEDPSTGTKRKRQDHAVGTPDRPRGVARLPEADETPIDLAGMAGRSAGPQEYLDPMALAGLQDPFRFQQHRFMGGSAGLRGMPLDPSGFSSGFQPGGYNGYSGYSGYGSFFGQPDYRIGMDPQVSQYLQLLALQRQAGPGYFQSPPQMPHAMGLHHDFDRFASAGITAVGPPRFDPTTGAAPGQGRPDLHAALGFSGEGVSSITYGSPAAPTLLPDGMPARLPVILARPEDTMKLSSHQVLLRHQIEVFQATEDDVTTHTRGRNKPVSLRQVGIRCRHCSHLPVMRRQKGSTYFPATLLGLYQAAQNMSSTHMQCGLCTEMPDAIKIQFVRLLSTKVASSGAGRPYWAESAKKLGLVDTEEGIHFVRDIPAGVRLKSESDDERYKK